MQKVMSKYNEQEGEIGKFVPFGLDKVRNPMVYAQIVQNYNKFLDETEMIPVFGIHHQALELEVEDDSCDQSEWKTLK